ncbi:MAG: response regulator [Anaerolineae bacterium]|nr:response regulator [Anaerolineae bacterium]
MGHSFSAPELGTLAYGYLLTVIDDVVEARQENWVSSKYRDSSYSHLFADLAYAALVYSDSDALGQERLDSIIDGYIAEPFASAVRNALNMVDSNLIHGVLTGVKPYMLSGLFFEERWKKLTKQNRTKPLLMIVDNSPNLAEGTRDIFELEGLCPDIFDIDITPRDSGAVCLICALAFEPDFMYVDIMLVGISGIDMMWFAQQWFSPPHMPYFVFTALEYGRPAKQREALLYGQAIEVFQKPGDYSEILNGVERYLKLVGLI